MEDPEITNDINTIEDFFYNFEKFPHNNTNLHKKIRRILLNLEICHNYEIILGNNLIKYNKIIQDLHNFHGEDFMKFIKIIENKDKINEILLTKKDCIKMLLYTHTSLYYTNNEFFNSNIEFIIKDFKYGYIKNKKPLLLINIEITNQPIINDFDDKNFTTDNDLFFKILKNNIDIYEDEVVKDYYYSIRLNKTLLKNIKYHYKKDNFQYKLKNIFIPIHYNSISDYSNGENNKMCSYYFTKPFRDLLLEILDTL